MFRRPAELKRISQAKYFYNLANKYKLSLYVVELICKSPFGFVNLLFKSDDHKLIRLQYLGKFKVKGKVARADRAKNELNNE